jgi:hypothetical protein
LVTQAAWQLGPLSDGVREWHVDLGIPRFGNALLRELESLHAKISGNWQEEVTVRTIGTLDASDLHAPCFSHPIYQLLSAAVFWSRQQIRIFVHGYIP